MLTVISPAKTLDFDTRPQILQHTQPDFLDEAEQLITCLRTFSPPGVAELMGISAKLANLNFGRYIDWRRPFTGENAKQAVLAFKGDVYSGLQADTLDQASLNWAQKHLWILSGLYGLLRPLDLIQPYRLEMGTALATDKGRDLYAFWGNKITLTLNKALQGRQPVVVNLASQEYFQAVRPSTLKAEVITPVFKDWKNGKYKIISFYAKKARGSMARYIIKNRIDSPQALKEFTGEGYRYHDAMSSDKQWIFLREPQ